MHVYLTHPQVRIDPAVPVPDWSLSEPGRERVEALARTVWIRRFRRIVTSAERKAQETATILSAGTGAPVLCVEAAHENDRSATGFLPPPEFEAVADAFFAAPDQSIRGWERAVDAQARIVGVVQQVLATDPDVPTLFIGHGGVGTLLKCWVKRIAITRVEDQGPGGGGTHFGFTLSPRIVLYDWRPIETPEP